MLSRGGLAGLVCGAALLTKYRSLTLLPVLAAWSAFNWWDYRGSHVLGRDEDHAGPTQVVKLRFFWLLVLGA